MLEEAPSKGFAFAYDQIVSTGELISTRIISAYLALNGIDNTWLDARDVIATDNNYREGNIDWEATHKLCIDKFMPLLPSPGRINSRHCCT